MLEIYYEPVKNLTAGYRENCEAWNMHGMHYHNTYEMYMLTDGERLVNVNGQEYLLKTWELLIVRPYILHSFRKGSDCITRYVMNIPDRTFEGFLTSDEFEYLIGKIPSCVLKIEGDMRTVIKDFFVEIKKFNYKTTPMAAKVAMCCAVHFFEYLKRLVENTIVVFDDKTSVIRKEILDAIIYINKHYTEENFGLDDVVEHVHMSKSRFCEVFREAAGQTFLSYLNLMRIAPVQKALWTTDIPLFKLAEEYGFSSVAHMTRVFNSAYGMSPSEFRKQNRKK